MSSGGSRDKLPSDEIDKRRIRPRRVWPGSRALVGGLLVAVAALGLFATARRSNSAPATRFVVATTDIAPGTRITAGMVGLQAVELPASLSQAAFGPSEDLDVLGGIAIGPIGVGELLQRSTIRSGASGAGAAQRPYEVSFEVESSRALNGGLRPGESVDVVATVGTGTSAATSLILSATLVVAVDEPHTAALVSDSVVVTLALDDSAAVVQLTAAVDSGQVTLVRAARR